MARRSHDDALGVTGAQTIIGTGVVVHGSLSSESDIVIDGTLDGDLKAGGNITIGVNANIKANLEAVNVTIAGILQGNISAAGEAIILETGHVKGDIKASGLSVASGAIFIGRSAMTAPPRLTPENKAEVDPMRTGKNEA